mgnify:FL=1
MAVSEGYKFKGEDTLYLVDLGDGLIRPFDQTGGSTSITADELEVSTKDRTGVDYGDVTETRSFEGELVHGDPFIAGIKAAIRNKEFVEIYEVNILTNQAEKGVHMISSFNLDHSHGDFATYTLDENLFGEVTTIELSEIPEGAPPLELGENDEGGSGGVEG